MREGIRMSMMRPSIAYLSKYLTNQDFNSSMELNSLSCLAVVCFALKFNNHDDGLITTVRRLDHLASECLALNEGSPKSVKKEREISEMFVNSFIPHAQFFFTVPRSSFPSSNFEFLADFIHFLLQILNCEADDIQNETWCVSLQKGLRFLLAVLEDIPFRNAELEEVRNLLEEFESVLNEAGTFIFSCAFTTLSTDIAWFSVFMHVLAYKFHLLNAKIKDYCIRYSKLPKVFTRSECSAAPADSLFIVESLLVDLENVMNHRLHLIDDVKDQTQKLQGKLMLARSFLMLHEREIGVKEYIIQIRDSTYEAEYLINSLLSEDFPVWYVTLRLPNVILKFDISIEGFQELDQIEGIQVREAPDTSLFEGDDIFVGYENEAIQILGELTGDSKNLQTFLLCGMPGIGKTTLAKKLYNDAVITGYFIKRAWCVVSQTYQKKKVLTDILLSLNNLTNRDSILKMDDDRLRLVIYQTLFGVRYFIVIDDVWNSDLWNYLRSCFPNDQTGSRILFTSRIQDAAPSGSITHTLPFMPEDQCWELLENKLFSEERCPQQLVNVGKQIAAKCNGLPLLVVIIAGILGNMDKEVSVWEKVEKTLDSYKSNCMKILELSYKHLPNRLKMCFLHLGVFLEHLEIPVRKLIWLWISEGLIPKEEGKRQEDVAYGYLNCLINRSLVLVAKIKSTGGVKACNVHDLLRDMCLKIAQEENYLTLVTNNHFSTSAKHQRFCVHSADLAYLRPFSLHCRAFFGYLSDPSSCFSQMKHVRAVELPRNIENISFSYKLKRIDILVRLRYLIVDRLPEGILSNLVNLEFLRIDSLTHVVYLPSAVLNMEKLRHLHVRIQAKFDKNCDIPRFNNLETLSILRIYNPKSCEVLKCSPHLLKLKCICSQSIFDFRFLEKLESLKIFALDIVLIPKSFRAVELPPTIRKLTLYGICLPWERMSVLGRLPNLQVLKLLLDAFVGEEWETSDDEFEELRFLKLEKLKIEEWIALREHFPKLRHLVFNGCEKLQKIPTDIGDIPTLEVIEVHGCSDEASISALEIEEQQRDSGNEELKVIITNDRWSKHQLLSKYIECQIQR